MKANIYHRKITERNLYEDLVVVIYKGRYATLYNLVGEEDPSYNDIQKAVKQGLKNTYLLSLETSKFDDMYQYVHTLEITHG